MMNNRQQFPNSSEKSKYLVIDKATRDTPLHAAQLSCLNNCLARSDLWWPGLDVRRRASTSKYQQILACLTVTHHLISSVPVGSVWVAGRLDCSPQHKQPFFSLEIVPETCENHCRLYIWLILVLSSHSDFVMICPGSCWRWRWYTVLYCAILACKDVLYQQKHSRLSACRMSRALNITPVLIS